MSDISALRQLAVASLRAEAQQQVEAKQRASSVAFEIKALASRINEWIRILNQGASLGTTLAYLEERPSEIRMLMVGSSETISVLDIDVTIGAKTLCIRLKDFAFGDDVVAEVFGPHRRYELRLSDSWGVYRQRSDIPDGIFDLEGPAPLDSNTFVELGTALFEDSNWR